MLRLLEGDLDGVPDVVEIIVQATFNYGWLLPALSAKTAVLDAGTALV